MADPDPMGAGELEFEPLPRTEPSKRHGLWFIAVVGVLAAGAGGGWVAMEAWGPGDGEPKIPLIRASAGPVKVRPESPGGMKVPGRDKLVYDRMQGNEEVPLVERLLPEPEQPLPPPAKPRDANMQPAPQGEAVVEEATTPAEATPDPPAAAEPRPEPPPAAPSPVPTPAEVLAAKPPQAAPPRQRSRSRNRKRPTTRSSWPPSARRNWRNGNGNACAPRTPTCWDGWNFPSPGPILVRPREYFSACAPDPCPTRPPPAPFAPSSPSARWGAWWCRPRAEWGNGAPRGR